MLTTTIRARFARGTIGYLDTPSMGLPTVTTVHAMKAALDDWLAGTARFDEWESSVDRCRAAWARLNGVEARYVGVVPSITSPLASVFAECARRPGVLLAHRDEFRSLLLPALAAFGADRVRWVDGDYTSAAFESVLDDSVGVVVISSVSSADGARPDLIRLADAADASDAQVVVDSTQSEGIVPLGTELRRFGAVVAAGYKGLLGPRGTGYVYADAEFAPSMPVVPSPYGMADNHVRGSYGGPAKAWPGGRGLSQSPSWLSWVGAEPALELLESLPAEDRAHHALSLTNGLRAGLESAGIRTQTTDLPSNIVSVSLVRPDPVLAALHHVGVRAAVPLGRLRLGVHIYTTESDIALALNTLLSLDLDHYERA